MLSFCYALSFYVLRLFGHNGHQSAVLLQNMAKTSFAPPTLACHSLKFKTNRRKFVQERDHNNYHNLAPNENGKINVG